MREQSPVEGQRTQNLTGNESAGVALSDRTAAAFPFTLLYNKETVKGKGPEEQTGVHLWKRGITVALKLRHGQEGHSEAHGISSREPGRESTQETWWWDA